MGLFDFFSRNETVEFSKYNKLFDKLTKEFPELSERELVISSCIAGLLARVAYVDFHLDPNEIKKIPELLEEWSKSESFDEKIDIYVLTKMALTHIQEMAGMENHLYVHPLKDNLSKEDRFKVVESLFVLAASDGKVEGVESEEIRTICKGLELSNQHFIAARGAVAKYLKALKD